MNTIDCTKSVLFRSFVIGLVLTISAPQAMAQNDDTTYMWAFLTTVKSDRVAEFEELLRTRSAGLEATGEGFRSVYESVVGDQFTYLMADYVAAIEVLDQPTPPGRIPPPGWTNRNDAATTAQTGGVA